MLLLLQQPLGPTLMKRRHIESVGFHVATIPFWRYKHDQTKDQKMKILREAILSSLSTSISSQNNNPTNN